jgi:hypothetical protein
MNDVDTALLMREFARELERQDKEGFADIVAWFEARAEGDRRKMFELEPVSAAPRGATLH